MDSTGKVGFVLEDGHVTAHDGVSTKIEEPKEEKKAPATAPAPKAKAAPVAQDLL